MDTSARHPANISLNVLQASKLFIKYKWFFFLQIEDANWGIDWDGPFGQPDDQQQVNVPAAATTLKEQIEAHLRDNIGPFLTSDVFGIDIYIEAVRLSQELLAS